LSSLNEFAKILNDFSNKSKNNKKNQTTCFFVAHIYIYEQVALAKRHLKLLNLSSTLSNEILLCATHLLNLQKKILLALKLTPIWFFYIINFYKNENKGILHWICGTHITIFSGGGKQHKNKTHSLKKSLTHELKDLQHAHLFIFSYCISNNKFCEHFSHPLLRGERR
jgi:hypothetical protein